MGFDQHVQCPVSQVWGDAGGVAESHGFFPGSQEFFEHVIHGGITRSTRQDFLAARHGLTNQFDDRGRFAGTGRTVNDGDIGGIEGEFDGGLLGWI